MRNIHLIEVASEFGAGTRGASLGMDAIRFACLKAIQHIDEQLKTLAEDAEEYGKLTSNKQAYLRYMGLNHSYLEGDPDRMSDRINFPEAKRIPLILGMFDKLVEKVRLHVLKGNFPLIVSGDHSNAAGTIAGIKVAQPEKRLGVIWVDAHADLHTPYSSPSGNVHGMPVAAVLNLSNEEKKVREPSEQTLLQWEKMCKYGDIAPKVKAEDMVFIGIRDLEQQEWDIISEKNIRYFDNNDVNKLGTAFVAEKTIEHLSECDSIYVSFDIDSLDSRMVPGTGTPVPDGLSFGQAYQILHALWQLPNLVCLEFTEVNPLLDYTNQTADVATDLLVSLLHPEEDS